MGVPLVPPALVLGCNTPHGISVLSDWIEERTGHPPDFDATSWTDDSILSNLRGDGCQYGYGDGDGYGRGDCYGYGCGVGYGLSSGNGYGYGYGGSDGDGYGNDPGFVYDSNNGISDGTS